MDSGAGSRQTRSRATFAADAARVTRLGWREFSRHLWKTSALSTIAIAGSGAAAAQEGVLWQPQVQTIIGADEQGGYSSLEGFIPLAQTPDSVLFLDLRIKHDFSNGTGGDVGLGFRHVVNPDLILGGYAYLNVERFDGHQYTGATLGVEAIGTNFDAHVNVHLPFGETSETTSSSSSSLSLVGNQLLEQISVLDSRDYASSGIEGEFGVQAPVDLPEDHSLRLHVGGYHFDDVDDIAGSITGGKAGFEYKIGDVFGDSGASVVFGGEVRYDNRDGTHFAGSVRLTVPLGGTDRAEGDTRPEPAYAVSEGLRKRANERVRGDIGVRVDNVESGSSLSRRAINARTGSAFGFFFAADGENTLGLGTLGDPTTLDDAVTRAGVNGFVVALGGSGNLLTEGVTLQNRQTVIGGGQSVQARLISGATEDFSFGGSDGTIGGTNAANPVISLANGNTLNGITVTGGRVGIFGNNINGATLTNVTVNAAGSHGASFTGTSTGVNASNFTASNNGGSGLSIEGDGTYNFTGTTLLSGNAVDGLNITGDGTYNFQTLNTIDNADDGIDVTSNGGKFNTTGGTVSGSGDVGVIIDPITANVVLTSISHDGGTSGVVLDAVSGSFTVTGETTISNTSGPAIAISNSPASIRFADITITQPGGDGLTFAGTNGPVVVGDIVITGLGAGNAGLDFSGSRTTFTAQSVAISGTGAAGSTGIDLSGTLGGSSIIITAGGVIASVETGVQLGVNGAGAATANANFVFGGGTIAGSNAALDARGLNPLAGTYAFGSTVFNGAQLFDLANLIFVGSTATGAGDGSSVNDLASIDTADANAGSGIVFALVNDGAVINDANGFTLDDGQTLASFGNGRQFALGGVPLNVTGGNVQHGAMQDDPTGLGAATLTNLGVGNTVILGDGTIVADIDISNGTGGAGIFGDNVDGATLTRVDLVGAGALFTGTSTNVSATDFSATGSSGSGLQIESDGTFVFDGTTTLSGNQADGLNSFGGGDYTFARLNVLNNGGGGIAASSGSFVIGAGIVAGNGLAAVHFNSAVLDVTLDSVSHDASSAGGSSGIVLSATEGSFAVLGATSISNTEIGGISIGGGSIDVGFGGAVSVEDVSLGGGISIISTAGTVAFSDTVDIRRVSDVGLWIGNSGVDFNGAVAVEGAGFDGIFVQSTDRPVNFHAPVVVNGAGATGFAVSGGNGPITLDGGLTVERAAFGGISVDNFGGSISFGGPVSLSEVGDGIRIGDSAGSVSFTGQVAINQSFGNGVTLDTNTGAVTFADILVSDVFLNGIEVIGVNGTIDFGNIDISGIGAATGLDLSGSTSIFSALSLDIAGTGAAGSTGIDLSGTQGGSVTIANGGVIQDVDTGVQMGVNGPAGTMANTDFVFGGGSVEGATASLDMRGLISSSGTYAFGSTALTGPQLFDPTNIIFVGASATGAGDGSSVNDLIDEAGADAIVDADAIFVLVNQGVDIVTDIFGFSLADGQTLASFGNGATFNVGGAPINVTGDNVASGFVQADPTGLGAARLVNNSVSGATIMLGSGNLVADLIAGGNATGSAIQGINVNNVRISGVEIDSGSRGLLFSGVTGVVEIDGIAIDGTVHDAISIDNSTAAFDFQGTTRITNAGRDGISFTGVSGSVVFDSIDIDSASNNGVSIANSSATFTFGGTTDVTNAGVDGVSLTATSGTVDFSSLAIAGAGRDGLSIIGAIGDVTIAGGSIASPGLNGITIRDQNVASVIDISNVNVTASGGDALAIFNALGQIAFAGGSLVQTGNGGIVDIADSGGDIDINTAMSIAGNGAGVAIEGISGTVEVSGSLSRTGGSVGRILEIGLVSAISGDIALNDLAIESSAGGGIRIDQIDAGASVQFDQNSTIDLTGTSGGIELTDVAGVVSIDAAVNIQNPTSTGISVSDTTGTVAFGGPVTVSSGAVNAVALSNNAGGTITFDGALDIDTSTGVGFSADGGGAVSIGGAGSQTIDTEGGTALQLSGVEIGSIDIDQITVTDGSGTGTDVAVSIDGTTGGTLALGGVSTENATSTGVFIANAAGTYNFNGVTSVEGSQGVGIHIVGSAGAISFAEVDFDDIDIQGTFLVSNDSVAIRGGTIGRTGDDAILSSDTSLTVQDLTIGAGAGSAVNGIRIVNWDQDRTVAIENLNTTSTSGIGGSAVSATATGLGTLTLNLSDSVLRSTGTAFDVFASTGLANTIRLTTDSNSFETATGVPTVRIDGQNLSATENTIVVQSFADNTIIGNGVGGGVSFSDATFDADPDATGIQQPAAGAFQIGQGTAAGQRVQGAGLTFTNTSGDIGFTALDIFNSAGTGLLVSTSATDFTLGLAAGTLDTAGGPAIFLDGVNSAITFTNVTSANSATEGLTFNDVSGAFAVTGTTTVTNPGATGITIGANQAAITFGTVALSNIGANRTGLALTGTNGGSIAFGSLSIALAGDNAVGVALNDAIMNGDLSATDFDLTSTSNVGTIGVNLVNTTGSGTIRLGDTVADGGQSASITGVDDGVLFSSTTNVNFIFGDGENITDIGSLIDAVTPVNTIDTLPLAGNYNFLDATLVGDTSFLQGLSYFVVDNLGTSGLGTFDDPGTIAEAEASGAAVIVLVDRTLDNTSNLIDLLLQASGGSANSLDLDDGQVLIALSAGEGIDVAPLGALATGAPPSFQFSAIGGTTITAPTTGIDNVLPTLTTGVGNTVNLAGQAGVQNLLIGNTGAGDGIFGSFGTGENLTIRNSTIGGATALNISATAGVTVFAFNDLTLEGTLRLDGTGGDLTATGTGVNTIAVAGGQAVLIRDVLADITLASISGSGGAVPQNGVEFLDLAANSDFAVTGTTTLDNYAGGNAILIDGIAQDDVSVSFGQTDINTILNGTPANGGVLVSNIIGQNTTIDFGAVNFGSAAVTRSNVGLELSAISGSGFDLDIASLTVNNAVGGILAGGVNAGSVTLGGLFSSTNLLSAAIDVSNSAAEFGFDGTATVTNAGAGLGGGIRLSGNSGPVVFAQQTTISVGDATGVEISGATGATSFNGLDITVGNATGFAAGTGAAGTVAVLGADNDITVASGVALDLAALSVGAGGLNFDMVASGGGAIGISASGLNLAAGDVAIASVDLDGHAPASVVLLNINGAGGSFTIGGGDIDAAGTGVLVAGGNSAVINIATAGGLTIDGGAIGLDLQHSAGTVNIGTGSGFVAVGNTARPVAGLVFASSGIVNIGNAANASSIGAVSHAISLDSAGTLNVVNLTARSTGGSGIAAANFGGSASFNGLTILGIAGANNAIAIVQAANSSTFDFTGLTIGGFAALATGNGIDIAASGAGSVEFNLISGNSVASPGTGLNAFQSAGATGTVALGLDGTVWETIAAGTPAISVGSDTPGGTFITAFGSNTVTGNGVGGGIFFNGVSFDADADVGNGIQQVVASGPNRIGTGAANRVSGAGLSLLDTSGSLDVGALDIFNDSGAGGFALVVDTTTLGTTFAFESNGGTIDNANGGAVRVDTATLSGSFASTSATFASGSGIDLQRVAGGFDFGGGALINNGGSAAFNIGAAATNLSGGSAVISYGGNVVTGAGATGLAVFIAELDGGSVTLSGNLIDSSAAAGGGILVQNLDNGAASVTFSGNSAIRTGAATGVTLADNASGTIGFTGGLTIATTTGTGFLASGGGVVNVGAAGSQTIGTEAGTALNLNGVTLGSVNFDQIEIVDTNATGTDSAVILDATSGGTLTLGGLSTERAISDAVSISNVVSGVYNFGNTSVLSTGFGSDVVSIFNSAGSFTFADLDASQLTGMALNLDASSATVTVSSGTIVKGSVGRAISVTGGDTSTVVFDAAVTATNGTGLLFDDADGSYSFGAALVLSDAGFASGIGIDILNDSDGGFTFDDVQITNTAAATALGDDILLGAAAIAVDIYDSADATTSFGDLDIVSAADIGVAARDGGTVNVGSAGDPSTINAGFGLVYYDSSGSVINANITAGTLVAPGDLWIETTASSSFGFYPLDGQTGVSLIADQADTSFSMADSTIFGAGGLISANVGFVDQQIALDRNAFSSDGGPGIYVNGFGPGGVFVTSLDSNTMDDSDGNPQFDEAGFVFDTVTFDADLSNGVIDIVTGGATRIGSAGIRVNNIGLQLIDVEGALSFSDLDIATEGELGLDVFGAGPTPAGFELDILAGDIDALDGQALYLENATLDVTLSSVTSTNAFGCCFSTGDGIALINLAGSFEVTGTTTVTGAQANGILIEDSAASIAFGTTNVVMTGGPGKSGIDFAGTNASVTFGTTTVSGIGESQTGIDFSDAETTATFGLTTITSPTGSGGSIGIDLSGTLGNRTITFAQGSNIDNLNVGVQLGTAGRGGATANATFTFGDGNAVDGLESFITAAAGGYTVDTIGLDPASGSYDFDDVFFIGDANLVVAPDSATFVSQSGGQFTAGGALGLSQTIDTISLADADALTAAGTVFAFVGPINLAAAGFDLDAGQSITGFGNGNIVSFGTIQPANVFGDLGATGAAVTGNETTIIGTDTLFTLAGGNEIRHTTFDLSSGVVGSAVFSATTIGAGNDITIEGVTITGVGQGRVAFDLTDLASDVFIQNNDIAIAGTLLDVSGGSGDITITRGTLPNGGPAGTLSAARVIVNGKTAGATVAFTNGLTLSSGADDAVLLTGNTGAAVSFAGGLDIASTTGRGFVATGGGTINVSGAGNTIATTTGTAIDLNGVGIGGDGMNFATVGVNGAATGINLTSIMSAGGGVALGTVNLQNVTSRGVDIETALGAALSITDLDIGLAGGAAIGFDLSSVAGLNADITVNNLGITSAAAGTTIGVDLSGAAGSGVVRFGGDAAAGDNATISGVLNGVMFSATTDLGEDGVSPGLVFGDGEGSDIESSIASSGLAIAGTLPGNGDYNFQDVDFGASSVSNLSPVSIYYVDPEGNGDGSLSNPGSIGGAEGSTANVIVLIDNLVDGLSGIIDMLTQTSAGNVNSLDLRDGQVLISFSSGSPATIDVAELGINPGGGAPSTFSFTGVQTSTVIDRPGGLDTERPTLTTSAAAGTVLLPTLTDGVGRITSGIDNVLMTNTGASGDGVNLYNDDLSTFVIRNSSITANGNAIDIWDQDSVGLAADTLILSIDGNTLRSNLNLTAGFDGQTLGLTSNTVAIRSFANNVLVGGATGGGGILFSGVTFDASDAAGIQAVNAGRLSIGAAGTPQQGYGLSMNNVSGTLNFADLDIVNNGGTGLFVDNDAANDGTKDTDFTLTVDSGGVGNATIVTTNGTALDVDPLTFNAVFSAITASGDVNGIRLDGLTATSSLRVSGATSITGTSGFGLSFTNNAAGATYQFDGALTIDNSLTGEGILQTSGVLTAAGQVVITTSIGVGISQSGGTANFNAGLTIASTTGTGVSATGGTINVAASGTRTINSTAGKALDLNGVTANINLQSAAAGGGNIGVSLVGMSGSLDVTGTVTINDSGADGMWISNSPGTVTFGSVAINGSGGTGIEITGANGVIAINGGNIGGSDDPNSLGVFIDGGTANVTINAAITKASTGKIVQVLNRTGGTVTFGGNLSATGGFDNGIDVHFNSGGAVNFTGTTKTLSTGTNTAVSLADNAGATINFTNGGLDIDTTTTGVGFNATGGGTVTVQGAGNSIASVSAAALNVQNTFIGASGLTFQRIDAGNATADADPANGIVLNTTGTTAGTHGGLTITGTGTTDGSGGVIQNIGTRGVSIINARAISLSNMTLTNANMTDGTSLDLDISASNAAIYLSGVTGAALNNIDISGTADNGITGLNVSDFTMDNSTITQAGNNANESGIEFSNLSGTSSISNSSITFSETNSLDVVNTDVNLNLTLNNVTFSDTQTVSSGGATNLNGEGGFQFRSFSSAAGAPVTDINVLDSDFLRLRTQGIQVIGEDDSVVNVDITNNVMSSEAGVAVVDPSINIGAGIDINGNDIANVTFNIIGNTIQSRGGAAANITSFLDSNVEGRINNNTITVNGIGSGVRTVAQETSNMIVEVRNNNITMGPANNSTSIDAQARFQTARLDLTLDNNTLNSDPTAVADINITSGSSTAGESNQVYVNIINNTVVAGGPTNILRLRVSDLSDTNRLFLQGFVDGGGGIEDDAVATWNANGNTPTATTANVNVSLTLSAIGPGAGVALVPDNPAP